MPTTTTSYGTVYSIVVSSTICPGYTPVSPYTVNFSTSTNSSITVNSSSSTRFQKDIYLSPQNYGNLFLLAQSSTSTYAEGGLTFTQTSSTTQFPLAFVGTTYSFQTTSGLTIDILNLDISSFPFVIQFYDSDLNTALVSDVFTVVNGSTISVNSGYYLQIQQANFTLTNGYGVVENATNSLYTTSFTTYINSYSDTVATGTCKQDSAGNYYLNVTSATSSTSLPLVFQFNTTISSIVLGATGYPITTDSDLPLVPFTVSNPYCSVSEATSYVGTLMWSNATVVTTNFNIPGCLVSQPFIISLSIQVYYKLSSFSFTPANGDDGPSSSNNYNLDSSIVIENIYGCFYEATSTFIMILEDSNNNVYYFVVTTN